MFEELYQQSESGNILIVLQSTNGFIIVLNEDAKFLYVADVAEKILGIKAV